MLESQVHPTARSKLSWHRIVKGFVSVFQPTVPSLETWTAQNGKASSAGATINPSVVCIGAQLRRPTAEADGPGRDYNCARRLQKNNPNPMLKGQVHPTARSKLSWHRIVKGFVSVFQPTVPFLETCRAFLGQHLLRKLFRPEKTP
jgi:alkylated DNA nucleotide flippase Atl1